MRFIRRVYIATALLGGLGLVGCSSGDADADAATPAPDGQVGTDAPLVDGGTADASLDANTRPGAPAGVSAVAGAQGGVTVSWTAPAGAAGVIVVRRAGAVISGTPVDAMDYAPPANLGAGEVVVYAGAAAMTVDAKPPPGPVHYAVFAKSAQLEWSPPGRASAFAQVPPQPGHITVTLSPQVMAVVNTQPPNLTLDAKPSYDAGTQTLSLEVSITSGYGRALFSPKLVVDATSQGALTADGTLEGKPYRRFGFGIGSAATATRTLVVTGVTDPQKTVELDVHFVDHPALFLGLRYDNPSGVAVVDTGTGGTIGTTACDSLKFAGAPDANKFGLCTFREGVMSADATRFYVGHRSLPVVRAVDPTTGDTVAHVNLGTGLGQVHAIVASADGTVLYALLNEGAHAYPVGDAGKTAGPMRQAALVRLDAKTLTETGRVSLYSGATTDARARSVALSPDGTRLAVSMFGIDVVRFFDTQTMVELDSDPGTSGTQPVSTLARPKSIAYGPDGKALFVYYVTKNTAGTSLSRIDTMTYARTEIDVGAASFGMVAPGPDGRIWVVRGGAVSGSSLGRLDPSSGTIDDVATASEALAGVVFSKDGTRAYLPRYLGPDPLPGAITVVDVATAMRIDTNGDAQDGVTPWPFSHKTAHWGVATPF
jgi:streptogramin lyase